MSMAVDTVDRATIEDFLHAQVGCWNAGDKDGFFAAYRKVAPNGLQIEYVGRPPADGWTVLDGMWDQQAAKVEVVEVLSIVNGSEAACHNRNQMRGTSMAVETIELYRFDAGTLSVRYFLRPPAPPT